MITSPDINSNLQANYQERIFYYPILQKAIELRMRKMYYDFRKLDKRLNKEVIEVSPNNAFKALADPTRRHILKILQKGDLSAGEIADNFNISKPSISHHLNILKQANLVQDYRNGQNIYYSLNTTVLQDIVGWFYEFIDSAEGNELDGLAPEKNGGESDYDDK